MRPYDKFMLKASGRDTDLERILAAKDVPKLDKYFRIVHGRGLRPQERIFFETVASALNTSVEDDHIMHLFVAGQYARDADFLSKQIEQAKTSVEQAGERLDRIATDTSNKKRWAIWLLIALVMASFLADVFIAGTVTTLSRRFDAMEAGVVSTTRK